MSKEKRCSCGVPSDIRAEYSYNRDREKMVFHRWWMDDEDEPGEWGFWHFAEEGDWPE